MINPSASGWIEKLFTRTAGRLQPVADENAFYAAARNNGFVYGHAAAPESLDKAETTGWTIEEKTKAALLVALFNMYRLTDAAGDESTFIAHAIKFYKRISPEGFNLFRKVLPAAPPAQQLEEILDSRIKTNENIISRNFSHILTNALLFTDVLAFRHYLLGHEPETYLKKLEQNAVGIVSMALKAKTSNSGYDELVIKLFESSVRYTKFPKKDEPVLLNLDEFIFVSEKYYLLDIAGMAMWADGIADNKEIAFLFGLSSQLGLDDDAAAESIASFDVFIKLNKKDIPYFKYSNPVKHFYDHAAQSVMLLINRNKTRLIKELSNNGELMLLLTHSTHRSLNEKERKKVKKQLLEICKTVPSLTIFLLPGGSLLLPLLIKFIPQLLPSVFNENLEKE